MTPEQGHRKGHLDGIVPWKAWSSSSRLGCFDTWCVFLKRDQFLVFLFFSQYYICGVEESLSGCGRDHPLLCITSWYLFLFLFFVIWALLDKEPFFIGFSNIKEPVAPIPHPRLTLPRLKPSFALLLKAPLLLLFIKRIVWLM